MPDTLSRSPDLIDRMKALLDAVGEPMSPAAEAAQRAYALRRPVMAALELAVMEEGYRQAQASPAIQALGFAARQRELDGESAALVQDWYRRRADEIYAAVPLPQPAEGR